MERACVVVVERMCPDQSFKRPSNLALLTGLVVGVDLGEGSNVVEFALGGVLPAVSGGGHVDLMVVVG